MDEHVNFTAVVPSYNQGRFLNETLRSLVEQRYPKLEIIVMDGGSTDNSVEIIKRYESELAYWTSEKDNGQSDAISRGFERARGDWLLWLNSDDALFPSVLESANQIIQSVQADIISGSTCWCDEHSKAIRFVSARLFWPYLAKRGIAALSQPSTFFSRRKYEEAGGLRKDLHVDMDTELWIRMVRAGAKVVMTNQPFAFFRKHKGAKGATHTKLWKAESANLHAAYGGTRWSRILMTRIFRACSLLRGLYFRDMLLSFRYRGTTIADIWSWAEQKED